MSTPDLNLLVTLDVLLAEGSVARLAPLPTSASDELRAADPLTHEWRDGNGRAVRLNSLSGMARCHLMTAIVVDAAQ